jgi:putative toxin-antitoxin system antitoxin component (TIGR02293 family)
MPIVIEDVAGILGIKGREDHPASPFEVIRRIENGLPIAILDRVSESVAPSDVNFKYRIVSRPTLARRRKSHSRRLSPDESERLARIAKIWALAREVWGKDEDARAFLFRPHTMLEGRTPIEIALKTDMGARLVEEILGRLQYGSAA